MADQRHICGACNNEFKSEADYLKHECSKTDKKPTDIEHQNKLTNGRFGRISEAALERGEARKEN